MTPRLSDHARQRCAERGIGTKRVKRVMRAPDVNRTTWGDRWIATSATDPNLIVVYVYRDGVPTVITVHHNL